MKIRRFKRLFKCRVITLSKNKRKLLKSKGNNEIWGFNDMAKDIKNKIDLNKYFDDYRECTFKAIVETFGYVGEEAIKAAREDHAGNWTDQTGNLRSSIGYMVTYDGKEVKTNGFETTNAPKGNGAEGQAEGRKFVEGLKGTNTEGFALVIVAGMNYAEYVEATGRDVLSGAFLHAKKLIGRMSGRIPERVEALMKKRGW